MLVHGRRPFRPETGAFASKSQLLERADIDSLHIPGTPETRRWLDEGAIGQVKPGAIIINTARGTIIEETALLAALSSGHLAGAGLDVFANEPLGSDAPILSAPNLVALPHVAWLTRETLERSLQEACANVDRLRNGRPLCNQHR